MQALGDKRSFVRESERVCDKVGEFLVFRFSEIFSGVLRSVVGGRIWVERGSSSSLVVEWY